MKETLEQLEQYGIEVILGRDKSLRARALRVGLGGLACIYRALVQLRLYLFRQRVIHDYDLGCMVVSIGNLTVGGTGKTPVVEMLARALHQRGRRVAVLSRGYKSRAKRRGTGDGEDAPRVVSDGQRLLLDSRESGDEPFMLARNLLGVPVVVHKNRVKGGRHALRHLGADTLILDDGLQYRRLRRRLDIVLVDRSAPFGNGRLLPRGTLREPPANLRRASYIFLTKCDGSSNNELIGRIRKHNRTAEIVECTHRAQHLQHLVSGERLGLAALHGRYVGAISGIAVPESFERGLERLGAKVGVAARFADHHRFSQKEVHDFLERCLDRDMHLVVTTEKDAVRFPLPERLQIPVYFLRIEIEIVNGQQHFDACIERICGTPGRAVKPGPVAVQTAPAMS